MLVFVPCLASSDRFFSFTSRCNSSYTAGPAPGSALVDSSRVLPVGHCQSSRASLRNGVCDLDCHVVELMLAILVTRGQSTETRASCSSFFCSGLSRLAMSFPVSGTCKALYLR